MNELENMTLGQTVGVLRKRIERNRFIEETARRERERDEAALSTLEALIGPEGGNGPIEPTVQANQTEPPSLLGLAAVREVMRERSERIWTPSMIHAELERRGWLSGDAKFPKAGTESAVGRLLGKGEIVKVARGRYRWRDQQEALTES
jgi:hypothetical protein